MGQVPELVAAADNPDPTAGLRSVLALRRLVDRLEEVQVDHARRQGWSWPEIADALAIGRREVRRKHAGRAAVGGSEEA